jgi:hypothetical protein
MNLYSLAASLLLFPYAIGTAGAQSVVTLASQNVTASGASQVHNPPSISPTGSSFTAFVGGSDSCATPDVISGPGPFSFNNSSATTGAEGQANANCLFFGTMGIGNDVWFTWTAGSTGSATLSLCGGTLMDSKVAVYAGVGCPSGPAIACNDDSCNVQSQVSFAVTSGNQYTIQLGNFPFAAPSSGTFTINVGGGLTVFGIDHAPLGSAGISVDVSGNLVVSNIGSSGNDGVSIETQQCQGHCYGLSNPDPGGTTLPLGAEITTTYVGSINGTLNQPIAQVVETKIASGSSIQVDYVGLGSPNFTIEAYLGEARIGVYPGNGGTLMKPSGWDKFVDLIGLGKPPCCRCPHFLAYTPTPSQTGELILTLGDSGQCSTGQTVQIDANPAIFAHLLRIIPNAPAGATVDFVSNVQVTAASVPTLTIPGELLFFETITHGALGDATFDAPQGSLTISNIGSSGNDGVSLSLGKAAGIDATWSDLNPGTGLAVGAFLDASATGNVSGSPGTLIGSTRVTKMTPGGRLEVAADFSPVGSTSQIVEVYNAGVLVVSVPGHTGPVANMFSWPNGCGKKWIWFPCNCPCWRWNWGQSISINVVGVGSFVGDELRIFAQNATGSVSDLDSASLHVNEISPFTLIGEHYVNIVPLATYCDPGFDGVIACPCGNPASGFARGCDNSSATGGAQIVGTGSASLMNDTVVLTPLQRAFSFRERHVSSQVYRSAKACGVSVDRSFASTRRQPSAVALPLQVGQTRRSLHDRPPWVAPSVLERLDSTWSTIAIRSCSAVARRLAPSTRRNRDR